jgi:hypothetical protein
MNILFGDSANSVALRQKNLNAKVAGGAKAAKKTGAAIATLAPFASLALLFV